MGDFTDSVSDKGKCTDGLVKRADCNVMLGGFMNR